MHFIESFLLSICFVDLEHGRIPTSTNKSVSAKQSLLTPWKFCAADRNQVSEINLLPLLCHQPVWNLRAAASSSHCSSLGFRRRTGSTAGARAAISVADEPTCRVAAIMSVPPLWTLCPRLGREQAESLLTCSGDFLVRESSSASGQYVLSGMEGGTVRHLLLVDAHGQVKPVLCPCVFVLVCVLVCVKWTNKPTANIKWISCLFPS